MYKDSEPPKGPHLCGPPIRGTLGGLREVLGKSLARDPPVFIPEKDYAAAAVLRVIVSRLRWNNTAQQQNTYIVTYSGLIRRQAQSFFSFLSWG